MLDLLIVILLLAWIGGFSYGLNSLVHLLLLVLIVALVYRFSSGRPVT